MFFAQTTQGIKVLMVSGIESSHISSLAILRQPTAMRDRRSKLVLSSTTALAWGCLIATAGSASQLCI